MNDTGISWHKGDEMEDCSKDTTGFKSYMALLVTCGFLMVMAALLYIAPPDGARDALMFTLGVVASIVKDVFGFYFGSSEGSRKKTDIIEAQNANQGA